MCNDGVYSKFILLVWPLLLQLTVAIMQAVVVTMILVVFLYIVLHWLIELECFWLSDKLYFILFTNMNEHLPFYRCCDWFLWVFRPRHRRWEHFVSDLCETHETSISIQPDSSNETVVWLKESIVCFDFILQCDHVCCSHEDLPHSSMSLARIFRGERRVLRAAWLEVLLDYLLNLRVFRKFEHTFLSWWRVVTATIISSSVRSRGVTRMCVRWQLSYIDNIVAQQRLVGGELRFLHTPRR